MRSSQALVVAKREFLTRIKSKGFWIATILLPLVMAAWVVIPGLVMAKARTGQRIVVVDATGAIGRPLAAKLAGTEETHRPVSFEVETVAPEPDPEAQRAALDREVLAGTIDAWVWVSPESLTTNKVEYHAESVSNFLTQEVLERELSEVVRNVRLRHAGYDAEEVGKLSAPIGLDTVRISEEGSREEGGIGGFALAIGLFLVLYMTIIIYGQQVMHGVLEEKSSRVVEVVAATVRPVELMGGKLLGICALGLTQLAIWMGTAAVLTAPGLVAAVAWIPEDTPIPALPPMVVVHFFILFLLGYVMFAGFFAMIGAAFNNPQEAQHMASVAMIFVVAPWMFFMPVINNPDSTLALVTSLIPPLTPLVMMLRIAVKMPPLWQILLSYALTAAFCCLVIWFAARVYRVGILMYGKKPTLKEIWRWARYA